MREDDREKVEAKLKKMIGEFERMLIDNDASYLEGCALIGCLAASCLAVAGSYDDLCSGLGTFFGTCGESYPKQAGIDVVKLRLPKK